MPKEDGGGHPAKKGSARQRKRERIVIFHARTGYKSPDGDVNRHRCPGRSRSKECYRTGSSRRPRSPCRRFPLHRLVPPSSSKMPMPSPCVGIEERTHVSPLTANVHKDAPVPIVAADAHPVLSQPCNCCSRTLKVLDATGVLCAGVGTSSLSQQNAFCKKVRPCAREGKNHAQTSWVGCVSWTLGLWAF